MNVKTRHFGDVEIDDSKVITMDNGLFGFENYKKYVLLYDSSSDEIPNIQWLQSLDEELLALPVMIPTTVVPDYNPVVEDETLASLGEWKEEDVSMLVTVTVPEDIKKMSINLKAPIVINTTTMKGCQVVAENPEYEVKHMIYELLEAARAKEE
ncbi:MAG: flagellar assembly protein FliW [Lachnospiraceae bacterium]|jgi:flagellar assembly factor FliW|nr:flagellar assembly protein FliW [Lachnospiraceae bacterium]MBQ5933155.1 flagellar assembly protein FliW [Lachnospiraceae bacterium]MBR3483140.1 flagellar assembly protein FliW [Lachnospiraceae bacterium]MBR3580102.1 flagellar assembly protein FliW [Lachnospiraceae bacterium]MBR4145385.1 flagellar assembly protein FliW [Lachnospiraceae bacterium]